MVVAQGFAHQLEHALLLFLAAVQEVSSLPEVAVPPLEVLFLIERVQVTLREHEVRHDLQDDQVGPVLSGRQA